MSAVKREDSLLMADGFGSMGKAPGGEGALGFGGGPLSSAVKDDGGPRGEAGEAAGLLEIEAQLQVDPEIAAARELDPSLLECPVGRLEAWASLLPQAKTELLDELGGGYLFLVSGDALLLHLLQKRHLDLELKRGLQLLRLVYQAERLLQQLQEAGGHFCIVFFDLFAAAEGVHALFGLLQQLLQLHLAKQGVSFLRLPHWFSSDFSSAVSSLHPLFILLNDVHLLDMQEELFKGDSAAETDSQGEEDEEETEGGAAPRPRQRQHPGEVLLQKGGPNWVLPGHLGANLWRAMESSIPVPISSSSSSSTKGETPGEAEADEQQQQEQQHCSLQRALDLHARMLQDIGLLPAADEEAAQQEEQQQEATALLQQLQQLSAAVGRPTAPLRYAVLQKYFFFLRAAAEDEDADEDEQQQLARFVAVGKLLLLAAAAQQQLPLQQRTHAYRASACNSRFVKRFLYAPLRLYCSQLHALLAQANHLYQQQQQQEQQQEGELLRLLDGREVADLFDGKLLVSLIGLAAAAARRSGDWSVSAAAVGLPSQTLAELETVWRACNEGVDPNVAALSAPLFPICLKCLRPLLRDSASLPPPRMRCASAAAAAAGGQQQQDVAADGDDGCGVHLLSLSSTFLQRLRAGGPPRGSLPAVCVDEEEDELQQVESETAKQLRMRREQQQQQQQQEEEDEEDSDEGIEGGGSPTASTGLEDSEEETALEAADAAQLQMLLAVRANVNACRTEGPPVICMDDAPAAVLKESLALDESRTPTRHELQKMENMNGEEKKKYWEARLRRKMQQNLRNVTRTAKCICPYPLHFNIVVNHSNHPWRIAEQQQQQQQQQQETAGAAGAAAGKGKGGKQQQQHKEKKPTVKKADLIRAKNTEVKQQKVKDVDEERALNLENLLEALCLEKSVASKGKGNMLASFMFKGKAYSVSPGCLRELLLEALIGAGRRMDLLLGLPAVTRILKTKQAQKHFALTVHGLVNAAYKDFARERCNTRESFLEMRRLLCLLFRLNVEIARMFSKQLNGEEIEKIQQSLIGLGFSNTARLSFETWLKEQQKARAEEALAAAADTHTKQKKPQHEAEVQLRFMGGDFERSTRHPSLPADQRVLFEPDFWQSRLFDAVDSYASAFVSAPTASGKTYVCFYAMELVLRDSNEGCVVYVCPNKALAQQVYAEIYGRFSSKSYPINCRKILSAQLLQGVCTPKALDAQARRRCCCCCCMLSAAACVSVLLSQVFVTVPYFLELLLLSGQPNHREFCRHIKYVVLDEVHCIAEQEEGSKWERIIQLLPCPFLAMSATVGNADSFLAWLRRSSPKHDIRFVSHSERFSDLHMHVYHDKRVVPLNPIAALHFNKILGEGLAGDFYVPPQDGLHFYLCLSRMLGEDSLFTQAFHPASYFQGTGAITKKQYRYYWQTMRECFVSLIRDTKEVTLERFAQLQEELQETRPAWTDDLSLFAALPALKPAAEAAAAAANSQKIKHAGCLKAMRLRDDFSKAYLDPEASKLSRGDLAKRRKLLFCFFCFPAVCMQKLLTLCRMLSSSQLLPCLIFNFSRPQVRRMGCSLSALLERLQWEKYYGTEEAAYRTRALNRQRMEQYEALLQEREVARRMRGMSRQQREAQGLDKQDLAGLEEEDEVPPPPGDIAEEIDEEFSFANPKAMGTNFDDIKGVLKDVHVRANTKQDRMLAKLLERGVGLFDDGLSKGYRVAVELLYRWGFLRIIICTHALALGMNLPCKSAVFAGDALALTPTMFKQAGGRAGRRGYDSAGHIIFWEVPFRRINRLLEARLPVFSGDFPVTPMLTLRTLRLNAQLEALGQTDWDLEDRLNRLFLNPLFSVSGTNHLPSDRELQLLRFYIRYHVRFAADLLHRAGLLSRWGEDDCAITKFGFAAELLYENNSGALLLLFLLLAGTLQRLASHSRLTQQDKVHLLLQLTAVCCGSQEGAEVTSNFVLQQLLQHRRDVARVRAKRFALERQDAAAAAAVPAASQQVSSDFKPFTRKFPPEVQAAVEAFNQMAQSSTAGCVRAAAYIVNQREGHSEMDFLLPLTRLSFLSDYPAKEQQQEQEGEGSDTLISAYKRTTRTSYLQSPFAALGCTADEKAAADMDMLQDSVRVSLPLQPEVMCAALPLRTQQLPVFDGSANRSVLHEVTCSNSYLLNLFTHGSLTRVVKENGIAPENLWSMLQRFVVSLQRLGEGLKALFLSKVTSADTSPASPSNAELQLMELVELTHKRLKEVLKEQAA
ncbi:hypothetical protein Efla_000059 [Eimeria flavescens]